MNLCACTKASKNAIYHAPDKLAFASLIRASSAWRKIRFLINLRWYITQRQAENYEKTLREDFHTAPESHKGFLPPYSLDKEEFVRQCKKLLAHKWPIQISSYLKKPEDIYAYFDAPEIHPYNNCCYKEWVRMDVMPNGNVTPCIQYPDIFFGNLKNKTIMEIWNSQEFTKFRRYIRKKLLPVCSKCYALYLYDGGRNQL
jgi:radical SAM protein with 4Fe4S-binding SPASM domain